MKGRTVTTSAVSLSRRGYREFDRITVLYTEEFGRVPVRFIGVERPRGKLKALSEPMVSGEYRLFIRDGAEFCIGTGGALHTIYPGTRKSHRATFAGLGLCALVESLTPPWQPAPAKTALLRDALAELERVSGGSETTRAADRGLTRGSAASEAVGAAMEWVSAAFALRLFQEAGFGLRDRNVSEENRGLWRLLHDAPWKQVSALPADPDNQRRLSGLIERAVSRLTERPLRAVDAGERILR